MTREEVITIIYQHLKILLGMKKVRFGKGKYNGFGGGLNPGENLEECAMRETFEEADIKIITPKKIGQILFQFDYEEQDHLVHFFKTDKFEGNPKESEEMKPEWFDVNKIPYDKMWDDDQYWMPWLLGDRKFEGIFKFGVDNKVRQYMLKEIK